MVLVHGWPLASECWAGQAARLIALGLRVITYDRRGMGRSRAALPPYDFDTYAEDLDRLMVRLDLTGAVLIGVSMGTGDILRYLGTYGADRLRKAVLISPLPLCTRQTASDQAATGTTPLRVDRSASGIPSAADFRDDLRRIGIPVLVMQGSADRLASEEETAQPLTLEIEGARLHVVEGGSNDVLVSHAEEIHRELLDFLR